MKDPIVTVSNGKLRGKSGKNIHNGQFYSFQGIPYAKPPVGSLRFKAPQPPEPWRGIRDATQEGSDCISRTPVLDTVRGGEDCLTLNVYTPSLPKQNDRNNLKAVMVWIHGGAFTSGSGSSEIYGPEFLLTEDVVLVTFNYRLGILGFLALEEQDLGVPGNAGLKDMVMALKWVQKNIVHFSGDPNNVTVFGESAGGVAAHYLVLSPLAKGLFHRAILQSGCALSGFGKGSRYAGQLAEELNLHTTDERKILKVLQDLPVEELFLAAEKVPDPLLASVIRPFGPVIERRSHDAFLSEYPLDIIRSGRYNHVPIMIGYTNREGILSEILQKPNPFRPLTDFELAVPNFLKLQRGSDMSKLIAKRIKEFYYGNEEPSADNKDKFYLLETDNFFLRELLLAVKSHVKTSSAPVFLYRMSIESTLNMLKNVYVIEEPGVCHADDLGYLFKNMLTPDIEPGSDEDVGIKRFVKLWTNFAKFGDPNPKGKDPVINIKWKPVTKNEVNFLDIGKNLTTGVNPEPERMSFWDEILKMVNFKAKLEPTLTTASSTVSKEYLMLNLLLVALGLRRLNRQNHGQEFVMPPEKDVTLPKQNNCNDLKAVMVWIHGGGFISGSGSSEVYGPDFLLTEDVVLVTINYRLGIFGFLSLEHPDLGVPGNAGLKDMVMALKWVQKNIVHFSGDSNNVTIFGESAGGAATHYLVLSPMAKGLFHRAIIQSGCALNVWAKGSRYVSKLAQVLNIHTTDERNILKILQELPAQEVYLAAEKVPDLFLPCGVRPQGPVIEHKSPEAFLSEYPLDIIRSGQYNHVPIMIGYTTREGMLAEILQKRNPLNAWKDFESAVPNFLALERGSDMSKLIAQRIKEFYYGDEEPFTNNKDKYYLLETDNLFLREMLLTTKRHAETSSVPIFLYRMSIETSLNMMKNIFGIEEPGVCHADDLGYLFKNMLTPNVEPGSEEDIGLKRFVKLWTNFAKFGDPNPKGNDPVIDIKWKPVTKSEINFLDIGKNLITGLNPEAERMRFWEDILKVNPNSKL